MLKPLKTYITRRGQQYVYNGLLEETTDVDMGLRMEFLYLAMCLMGHLIAYTNCFMEFQGNINEKNYGSIWNAS